MINLRTTRVEREGVNKRNVENLGQLPNGGRCQKRNKCPYLNLRIFKSHGCQYVPKLENLKYI